MKFWSGGYSGQQYNNAELKATAHQIAQELPRIMEQTGADAVVVSGKSGIALAFAALMLIEFPLIVVRKRGESSHGSLVEGTRDVEVRKYLIMDDFVDSGDTVKRIVHELDLYAQQSREFLEDTLTCVGVYEYKKSRRDSRGSVHTEAGEVPRL